MMTSSLQERIVNEVVAAAIACKLRRMAAPPFDTSVYKQALVVLGAAGVVIPLFHRLRVSAVLG